MKGSVALGLVVVGLVAGAAGATTRSTGVLRGTTQISFGCPGPVSPSSPTCHPWRAFPHARFSVTRGSVRIVVTSNAQAKFSVRLAAGSYVVTPLPQRNTRGGARLTVRVHAGIATTTLVRFLGYPQME